MSQELQSVLDQLRADGVHLPLSIGASPAGLQTIKVSDLLEGPRLREMIERIAHRKGTDDLIAAASLFQKRYCGQLLAAILTPLTHLGIGFLAPAEQVEIVLVEDLPAGIVLHLPEAPQILQERVRGTADLHPLPRARHERELRNAVFQALFDDNLGRLSLQIATEIRLSLRVMWGNIGNYSCYLYEGLCQNQALTPWAARDRDALLTCTGVGKNPPLSCSCEMEFFDEIEPPRWVRVRATCCLAYKFGQSPCITCPKLSREERVLKLGKKALHKA